MHAGAHSPALGDSQLLSESTKRSMAQSQCPSVLQFHSPAQEFYAFGSASRTKFDRVTFQETEQ
jgi:hypothetical protein